jgi:hypothetical protein
MIAWFASFLPVGSAYNWAVAQTGRRDRFSRASFQSNPELSVSIQNETQSAARPYSCVPGTDQSTPPIM